MTTRHNGVFVGREGELGQLRTLLERTLAGKGQVAFVTGEAGSGKTTLVHQFCRQAQDVDTNLVVATGQCDAQTGAGTPYLPFVEILRLLTGDVAGGMADEALSEENASRLKSAVEFSVDALFAFGPDLIDVFVPGSGLMVTAGTFIAEQTGLSDWLQRRMGRQKPQTSITQENIFEQYSNVIHKFAESHPLILVLDDLQWADAGSCQLLFRLGRRIEDRPVLILGTYRPNDVAAGRDGDRHPLEPVTAELTRYYGNARIDLDQAPAESGAADDAFAFVSAYVESAYSPHTLDDDFLHLIADRTEGHPLFVVELLRDLEERGWLAHGADGGWMVTQSVTFEALPPRVEGIIGERIGRLDEHAQETLTIGAVEGDEFTAQVVAQVQGSGEREVVRRLSRELGRRHQLVAERGVERLGRQRLYRFAFRHSLFQTHVYNALGDIDRSLLHEDVGLALEEVYGEQADDIAVALSHHFSEAGLEEHALPYLVVAGDQAYRAFANQEAVDYYSRALAIVDEMLVSAPAGEAVDWQAQAFDILGKREEVYDRLGEREAQAADLERMLALAGELGEQQQAEVYKRRSHYFWAISDHEQAVESASRALPLMQARGDVLGEGTVRRNLGRSAQDTGQYEKALEQFLSAADLFESAGAPRLRANVLIQIGSLHSELGRWEEALQYLEPGLSLSREIDAKREQAWALDNIAIVQACIGDYSAAMDHSREALSLAQTIGDRLREVTNLSNLALISAYVGDYHQAIEMGETALAVSGDIRYRSGEVMALINLGGFRRDSGQYEGALQDLAVALELVKQSRELILIVDCYYNLAKTYCLREQPGDEGQTIEYARETITTAEQTDLDHYQVLGRSWLAKGYLNQDNLDEAVVTSTQAVEHLEEIGAIEGSEEEVYFNHFRILQAAGQPQAAQALQKAEKLVHEKAEKISDPALCQGYLEQVPLNRQILRAAENHA